MALGVAVQLTASHRCCHCARSVKCDKRQWAELGFVIILWPFPEMSPTPLRLPSLGGRGLSGGVELSYPPHSLYKASKAGV